MSFTLADITPRVRQRLNDSDAELFTDIVLLPYAQDACDELQLELELFGALILEEVSTPPITIPIYTNWSITGVPQVLGYNTTPALPADLLEPQRLEERLSGSTDMFVPMIARQWEPDILPSDSLRYWSWREQNINFIGATTLRDIKIYYLKRLLNVTSITNVINVNNSQLFLTCRIAGMAARDIGENPTRADELDQEAEKMLNKLTRIGVKNKQRTRTRRRPFVLTSRRRWV